MSYMNYAINISQSIAGYMIGGIQANLQAGMQKYRNEMLKVQEAMNANRLTVNEINTMDANQRLKFAIQRQSHSDAGSAEVNAAAAGVRGGSVNATARGLTRSAAFAQQDRTEKKNQEMRSWLAARRDNALATATAKEIGVFEGPSILSAAAGLATNLLNTYQDNQTATQKAGPSSVKTSPSTALGLGPPMDLLQQNKNLLQNDFWIWNTGPNG